VAYFANAYRNYIVLDAKKVFTLDDDFDLQKASVLLANSLTALSQYEVAIQNKAKAVV
jgi:D-arabinose 1-dehydrogenase-like Zn-dependent alcohol dehydrogenase